MSPTTLHLAHSAPRDAEVRRDQAAFGREAERPEYRPYPAGQRREGQGNTGYAPKKPFVAKGHDRQLQEAQNARLQVKITLGSGDVLEGTIAFRDKYTITMRLHNDPALEIVYKHAIDTVKIFPAAQDGDGSEEHN